MRKPTINSLRVFIIRGRMNKNRARVASLISMYDKAVKFDDPRLRLQATDLLRSAVVFLHATLEDTLRDVAALKLPDASVDALNQVPLAGVNSHRPEKFFLGALVDFKGATVEEVIRTSVKQHLDRQTFNSARDLIEILRLMGIQRKVIRADLGLIESMMKRRHYIVHQGDERKEGQPNQFHSRSLNKREVSRWIKEAECFLEEVLAAIDT